MLPRHKPTLEFGPVRTHKALHAVVDPNPLAAFALTSRLPEYPFQLP